MRWPTEASLPAIIAAVAVSAARGRRLRLLSRLEGLAAGPDRSPAVRVRHGRRKRNYTVITLSAWAITCTISSSPFNFPHGKLILQTILIDTGLAGQDTYAKLLQ